jgi:O-antigen/teichoic acid export membrane protein
VSALPAVSQRHRDFYLVFVKLLDVAARAGFILTATYGLPIDQAGRFGLIATLIGLFAFAFNFERQIDIQRRSAGEHHSILDRYVVQALKFFAFNWALMIPLFLLAVLLWTGADPLVLAAATVVVVGEHLSNQAYQYALIHHRYAPMLTVVAAKNAVLATATLAVSLFHRELFNLDFVLTCWAAGAVLCTMVLGVMFLRIHDAAPKSAPFNLTTDILGQHKASMTHFLIGLIAVLVLQFDRLAVGGLLSLEQTGVYFRHALLISLAYQMFSIASFNRVTPSIFAAAKIESVSSLVGRILREYRLAFVLTPLFFAGLWVADRITGGVWTGRFHIELGLVAIMLLGFMVRAAADFPALIMNALHRERVVLHRQAFAFAVGGCLLVSLTHLYGLWGAAWAMVCTSLLYATLNWIALLRLSARDARERQA